MAHVRINSSKLTARLTVIATAANARAAENYRAKVREEIIASGRVQTGEMGERIDIEPASPRLLEARHRIRPRTKQFLFQNWGTRGTPSSAGKVLRFKPKGSGVFIFRRSAGPISPAHFLRRAKERMRPSDWK